MNINPNDQAYPVLKAHSIAPGLSIRAHFASIIPLREEDFPDSNSGCSQMIGREWKSQYSYMAKDGPPTERELVQQQADLEAVIRVMKADALIAALNKDSQ